MGECVQRVGVRGRKEREGVKRDVEVSVRGNGEARRGEMLIKPIVKIRRNVKKKTR